MLKRNTRLHNVVCDSTRVSLALSQIISNEFQLAGSVLWTLQSSIELAPTFARYIFRVESPEKSTLHGTEDCGMFCCLEACLDKAHGSRSTDQ